MPSGDLIGYLAEVLKIGIDGEATGQITESPITLLTSVFILNTTSMKSQKQAPISAGPQDAGGDNLTYDQLFKIVFKINIWICNNAEGFFTEG